MVEGERDNDDNDEYVYIFPHVYITCKNLRMEWMIWLGGWGVDRV